MDKTIGTCSICGGPVRVPAYYYSVLPPTPSCVSCHAVPATHGPVVPMAPKRVRKNVQELREQKPFTDFFKTRGIADED